MKKEEIIEVMESNPLKRFWEAREIAEELKVTRYAVNQILSVLKSEGVVIMVDNPAEYISYGKNRKLFTLEQQGESQ